MAENVVLNNLANLQNDTTTINTINGNNATITSAFVDVLSRSGVQPNQMNTFLDMNNFPIMNLPAPGSANSPARLVDVTGSNPISISLSLSGDVTAPASSGVLSTTVGKVNGVAYSASPSTNTVPVVTGSNIVTYEQIPTAAIANNAITAAQIANNTITSAQIANNTISNAQIRQGAPTSVVGNSTNVTGNVGDIGASAARQVLSVNTAGTALAFAQPQGDQLKGTTTNDNATAGNVGEYIQSVVTFGAPVALTTVTPANLTSISLTAGDWDVSGQIGFTGGTTTTVSSLSSSISTTSATISQTSPTFTNIVNPSALVLFNGDFNSVSYAIPTVRLSLSTTTTVFLCVRSAFGTSTCSAFGYIGARRAR